MDRSHESDLMKKVMILSGAGLSAESDIRTFRDHNGLWEEYDVLTVCSVQGWEADRNLVTEFYNKRRQDLKDKVPNAAHAVLARLEKEFPGQIVNLTQNVDDLLERAGCQEVIHLHGTLTDLRCEECHAVWNIGYESQYKFDTCPRCESDRIRHNVVMFGESAPNYRHIYEAMQECDLFVAIGTSGQVIDIVDIAAHFDRSLLVNPKREEHVTMFGSFDKMIDEYFSDFIQEKAGIASDAIYDYIAVFLR